MDEKTREALDRILKSIRDARRTRAQDDPFGYRARTWPATEEIKDLEALAHLQAMAEENERLRADVHEWVCEYCYRVYPGPPQAGVKRVICPKCYEQTIPRLQLQDENAALKAEVERLRQRLTDSMGDHVAVSVEAEELQARAEKAEAEAEQNKALIADLTQDMNEYHDKAETAEAELAEYKSANEKYWQMLQEQGKELARWRPLIEAVGRAGEAIIDWDGRHTTKAAGDILRSALKCREEKP